MKKMNREVVEKVLLKLKEKHGFLTPQIVVDEAKNPRSALHTQGGFEWDLAAAAERHWLDHAKHLIKTVRISVTVENTVFLRPRFVVHPDAPRRAPHFVEVKDLKEEGKETDFLMAEFKRIENQILRAKSYACALGLGDAYNSLLSATQNFRLQLQAKLKAKAKRAAA